MAPLICVCDEMGLAGHDTAFNAATALLLKKLEGRGDKVEGWQGVKEKMHKQRRRSMGKQRRFVSRLSSEIQLSRRLSSALLSASLSAMDLGFRDDEGDVASVKPPPGFSFSLLFFFFFSIGGPLRRTEAERSAALNCCVHPEVPLRTK